MINALTDKRFQEMSVNPRKKGRDLTQSYDKSPYTHRKIKKNIVKTFKNATKTFDYTTIADRLRTVSWSNSSQPNWCGLTGLRALLQPLM